MMFDLSADKIIVLVLVAAFLIGPKRLPAAAAWLARATRGVKALAESARERAREELGDDFADIEWQKLDPRRYDPRRIIASALTEAVADMSISTAPSPADAPSPDRNAHVLVIGEALVDVVEDGNRSTVHPGGSPMNVAYGLGRLGIATTFATEFADDENGRLLAEHLDSARVQVLRGEPTPATSVATVRLDDSGSAHYEFALDWDFSLTELPAATIVHTGSIGAVREPGSLAVQEALDALAEHAFITFDPNVRPAFLPDRDRSCELVAWYCRRAALVKLSEEDAAWLYPGSTEEEVLDILLGHGAKVVAMTKGAQGSVLRGASARVDLEPWPTTVVDTIGAGDAYMTGLIVAVLEFDAIERIRAGEVDEVLLRKLGTVAAAEAGLTVGRAGAAPPSRAELDAATPWSEKGGLATTAR